MLRLVDKVGSDKYSVLDTKDGVVEVFESRKLIDIVLRYGLEIEGISVESNGDIYFENLGIMFTKKLVGNKFRIYPNKAQEILLNKIFGCCRFIWNHLLADRIAFYQNTGESLQNHYNYFTKEYKFLKGVPQRVLQLEERKLDTAYKNFFRGIKKGQKIGFPKYKKKYSSKQSFSTYNDGNVIKFEDNYINLPKIGKIKVKQHRYIAGRITTVTVSKTATDKYYVSFNTEEYVSRYVGKKNEVVGLDLGIKDLAILDNGDKIENTETLDKYLKELRWLQQRYSRTQKGSNNRKSLQKRIARVHEKIANIRKDSIHKFTRKMIDENQAIITEDLNIRGLMSNKTHRKKKRTRDRHIVNASWGEITRQLSYKSEWRDNVYQKIGRTYPSTQLCHVCNYKNEELRGNTKIREWVCPKCNTKHDRDINAAINIRNEGKRLIGLV